RSLLGVLPVGDEREIHRQDFDGSSLGRSGCPFSSQTSPDTEHRVEGGLGRTLPCKALLMADTPTRLLRYRVVEELVELAASAEEQIDHFRPYYMERLKGYLNWSFEMLSGLAEQGALSPEIVRTTDAVTAAL